MHPWDVIGYVYEGAAYCAFCCPVDESDEEVSPIFADSEWDSIPCCDGCLSPLDDVSLTAHGITYERAQVGGLLRRATAAARVGDAALTQHLLGLALGISSALRNHGVHINIPEHARAFSLSGAIL